MSPHINIMPRSLEFIDASARELRAYHRAMGDETRLRIIELLGDGNLNVAEIARRLKISQPLLTWHLHRLKRGGIVGTQRIGGDVRCFLNRAKISQLQELDGVWAASRPKPQAAPRIINERSRGAAARVGEALFRCALRWLPEEVTVLFGAEMIADYRLREAESRKNALPWWIGELRSLLAAAIVSRVERSMKWRARS